MFRKLCLFKMSSKMSNIKHFPKIPNFFINN